MVVIWFGYQMLQIVKHRLLELDGLLDIIGIRHAQLTDVVVAASLCLFSML